MPDLDEPGAVDDELSRIAAVLRRHATGCQGAGGSPTVARSGRLSFTFPDVGLGVRVQLLSNGRVLLVRGVDAYIVTTDDVARLRITEGTTMASDPHYGEPVSGRMGHDWAMRAPARRACYGRHRWLTNGTTG